MRFSLKSPVYVFAAVALAAMMCLLLSGCGVDFSDGEEQGTELLKTITLDKQPSVNDPVQVKLTYTQVYDVDVMVRCELEDKDEALIDVVGEGTIVAGSVADAKTTPTPQTMSFSYIPKTPGTYWLVCKTPAEENNAISKKIVVAP